VKCGASHGCLTLALLLRCHQDTTPGDAPPATSRRTSHRPTNTGTFGAMGTTVDRVAGSTAAGRRTSNVGMMGNTSRASISQSLAPALPGVGQAS
jgi:hypothetical protein